MKTKGKKVAHKMSKLFLLVAVFTIASFNNFVTAQVTEVRNVSKFTQVSVSIAADIILTQGETQKIEIEGSADDLKAIDTKVFDNKLSIETNRTFSHINKVKIYLTVKKLEAFEISGSSKLVADGAVKADTLLLDISGSGSIKFTNLRTSKIAADISGSGNIHLEGKETCEQQKIEISGSGHVNFLGLACQEAKVEISGSGTCKIYAIKKLKVETSGSGNVYYKGNPVIRAESSGSGKILPVE